jgi:hypothetical protein
MTVDFRPRAEGMDLPQGLVRQRRFVPESRASQSPQGLVYPAMPPQVREAIFQQQFGTSIEDFQHFASAILELFDTYMAQLQEPIVLPPPIEKGRIRARLIGRVAPPPVYLPPSQH